jgi:hypothetical protein
MIVCQGEAVGHGTGGFAALVHRGGQPSSVCAPLAKINFNCLAHYLSAFSAPVCPKLGEGWRMLTGSIDGKTRAMMAMNMDGHEYAKSRRLDPARGFDLAKICWASRDRQSVP